MNGRLALVLGLLGLLAVVGGLLLAHSRCAACQARYEVLKRRLGLAPGSLDGVV